MILLQRLSMGYFLLFLLFAITRSQGEDGMWDQWSDFTPCSRTCGGGVRSRMRGCMHMGSGVGHGCVGPDKEYSSCNVKICAQDSKDFRAVQCAKFDRIPMAINGKYKRHKWIPHYDENNKCALKCQTKGGIVVRMLEEKAVDGTQCDSLDVFGICVSGVCQTVGCDRIIGSFTKEDKCGVCGGDGSACKTVNGIFDQQNLKVGYHDVVTIPEGATSIAVREMGPSKSHIAIKNEHGHYYLNGDHTGNTQLHIAGTVFKYILTDQASSPESLSARGPSNETLHFQLVAREGNPGVQYEYSIPQRLLDKASPSNRYTWVYGRWTGCSTECGEGYQLRAVSCMDREGGGGSVQERYCDRREKPITNQTCSNRPCVEDRTNGYSWVLGHWGECSSDCGIGEQAKLAYCQEKGTMGQTIYVSDDICVRYLGPKPEYKRVCSDESGCPHWATSPWNECNVTCGYGYQSRRVYCQRETTDSNEVPKVLTDQECSGQKRLKDRRICNLSPCSDGTRTNFQELEGRQDTLVDVDCSATRYGCCADGKTAATGPNYHGCLNTHVIDKCSLEQSRGPCGDYTLKWYFDSEASTCNMFWYGNCGGNDNRFDTEEECESACLRDDRTDNQIVSIDCGTSTYGCCQDGQTSAKGPNQEGCPTNTVLFNNLECHRARYGCCADGTTAASGPNHQGCGGDTSVSSSCAQTTYGCCPDGKKAARGWNEEGCGSSSSDVFDTAWCGLPKETGRCRDFNVQWFYNPKIGSCTQFWYGGCGGNGNRFVNKTDCENACVHVEGMGICRLPMSRGPCKAGHPRFFYDYQSEECRPFTYGGCRGNPNRFRGRTECEAMCSDSTYIDSEEDEDKPTDVESLCRASQYGCCSDGKTAATGPNQAGCGRSCKSSPYGCCDDGVTAATGPDYEGCEVGSGTSTCDQTDYGCCSDGITAAAGPNQQGCDEDVIVSTDTDKKAADVCKQGRDTTRCKEYIVKWYYDMDRGYCDRFWYGGCEESDNRFDTEEECVRMCKSTDTGATADIHACDQPKVKGPCKALLERFYFDRVQQRCRPFKYGGCQGNANNFHSERECQRVCRGTVATVTPAIITTTPRPYDRYSTVASSQSSATISGTDRVKAGKNIRLKCKATPLGNGIVRSIEWFKDGDKINQEDEGVKYKFRVTPSGDGARISELTIYNSDPTDEGTYYCRSLPFGDVASVSVQVLDITFYGTTTTTPAPVTDIQSDDPAVTCMHPVKPGSCSTFERRWHYNHEEGVCHVFGYSGCDGNGNNFRSKEECVAFCKPDILCTLPAKTGVCRGYFRKWYFDMASGKCKEFTYGGCGGNPNNFASKKACHKKCGVMNHHKKGSDVCHLPREGGSCGGYKIVWYYDIDLQRCRRFIYTGCGGNANQFKTEKECRATCRGESRDGRTEPKTYPPTTTTTKSTTARVPIKDLCEMRPHNGQCESNNNYTIWWYYDSERGYCSRFYYGGCGGNDNRFANQQDCENKCVYGRKEPATTPYPVFPLTTPAQVDCRYSAFGCCDDGYTLARDASHSNCDNGPNVIERQVGEGYELLVRPNHDVTLSCHLQQNGFRGITWYRDGFLIRPTHRYILYHNGSLTIKEVSQADSGTFSCRVNGENTLSQVQRYKVQVRVPLSILPSPSTISVKPGRNAFLHCQVYGTPLPRVSWMKDNSPVSTNGRYHAFNNGTLIIVNTREEDVGEYECLAENGISGPARKQISLVLRELVTAKLDPYKGKVNEGGTIRLRCSGSGYPEPTIHWEKDGTKLESSAKVHISEGELVIPNAVIEDSGAYTCVVSNPREQVQAVTTVQVVMHQTSDKCENTLSEMNCQLILRARLCGHRMFSKMCCIACSRQG